MSHHHVTSSHVPKIHFFQVLSFILIIKDICLKFKSILVINYNHLSLFCALAVFFGEEQSDGVTYWWPATWLVILSEIRTCDNRWPVVNQYFVLNVLISKTNKFLDKKFYKTQRCDIHNSLKQFHLKLNSHDIVFFQYVWQWSFSTVLTK